jgi:hypothetical protein
MVYLPHQNPSHQAQQSYHSDPDGPLDQNLNSIPHPQSDSLAI